MKILAIETSCDETAIALLVASNGSLRLQKNKVYSQIDLHKKYGGVVPELAARKHVETIIPMIDDVVARKGMKEIDYIAVTQGPGLITSLLLGISAAKTLAVQNDIPLLGVNHMEGHVYSNWISNPVLQKKKNIFPALNLIVSGGHTELVLMTGHGKYKMIGQTLDDAVGEAFDKVAKLMKLGYPGGPIVSKKAANGDPTKFDLPRPMIGKKNFDFSFAGLKTAVLYALEKKKKLSSKDVDNLCASFQEAVVDVLVKKTFAAADKYKVKTLLLSGGVSANTQLREALAGQAKKAKLDFYYPKMEFCTDNAAMIATAAYYKVKAKKIKALRGKQAANLQPRSNWQIV